jgi:ABC-type lipoprotein export system ATPase subunit
VTGAPLVVCEGVGRTYGAGTTATVALQPVDCEVRAGDRIALVGPSGSGKSTLLHLMAGLDRPTVGRVSWPAIGGHAALRPGPVTVMFQGPSLLAPLTVVENVALPLILDGMAHIDAHHAAAGALQRLGLASLRDKLPEEISGGQAQRVAAARALAGRPALILADEPTGQLDRTSGAAVVEVLLDAADRAGAALVVSTHDPRVVKRFPAAWQLHGGHLITANVKEAAWSR